MGKLLESLNKDDTYSMLGLLLYASSDNPRYALLNELAYILDNKSFVNFIKYFEGQTIQIPSIEEIQMSLKVLMLYQYYYIEEMSWEEAITKAGFLPSESIYARSNLIKFVQELESNDYKLGGIRNVAKGFKL